VLGRVVSILFVFLGAGRMQDDGWREGAYLILLCVFDVDVVVELDGGAVGGVDDIADGLLFPHDAVVVTAVGGEEDGFAVRVVAGYVAHGTAEAGDREVGCHVVGAGRQGSCLVGHFERLLLVLVLVLVLGLRRRGIDM